MKRLIKKSQKLVKGMPSAVIASIVFHAVLFFLAGLLVVFTVVKKEEKQFEPPKAVERPKMKLKKPKVKIKKSSKPKTTRIVTKMNRANMPDIQLPEVSGMGGEGLGGALGGFDMLPDLADVSAFGSGQSIGNDLIGTFYDFGRDYKGRPFPVGKETFQQDVADFVESGWKTSRLRKFYKSPTKLFATNIMIPPIRSTVAPYAFGEPDTGGYCWMVHYKGQLVHNEGITFRFWGQGDDLMVVRVDGKLVLSGCWPGTVGENWPNESKPQQYLSHLWQTTSSKSRRYWMGNHLAEVGDWITLEPGVPLDLEIMIGEVGGGSFCAMLAVEEKGGEYERGPQGNPILPAFKTTELSHEMLDNIYKDLRPGEVCLTNDLIFSDYDTSSGTDVGEPEEVATIEPAIPDDDEPRMWTSRDGKILEASFVTVISDKVVLSDAGGKTRKIPLDQLSDEDRLFTELARVPRFNIDFSKNSSQYIGKMSPFNNTTPPRVLNYVFSAKLKQTSAGSYNHDLHVEFFAIGAENIGKRYVLLDRQESHFTPTRENEKSHKFSGKNVRLSTYQLTGDAKGIEYDGYLIVITDSRGKIIAHKASSEWLFENREALKRLPVGAYMDKTCSRRFPSPPTSTIY